MSNSQLLAIAAHLHVVLRRKTGRVTDIEWMVSNREYAMEIVRFTRARATEDKVPELAEWAEKLHRALIQQVPQRQPLVQQAAKALRERAPVRVDVDTTMFGNSQSGTTRQSESRFVESRQSESRFAESRYSESRFAESRFADAADPNDPERPRRPRDPRYVGGIR
jgi:hypothetical protein